MATVGALLLFGLFFAAVLFLPIRRVWLRYRVIAIAIPAGSDPQALRYKLTEAVRSFGYRADSEAGPGARFRAPAWQRWAAGLQDISVEPAGGEAVLVTGPAFWVARIARGFKGVITRPYDGRQPVWPLVKGLLRLMAIGLAVFGAIALVFYLVEVR